MQLAIDSKNREIKNHGNYVFPVRMSWERLSNYERGAFACHWHPEIELTLVTDGTIVYQCSDKITELSQGQVLFCNTNVPHSGHMKAPGEDAAYLSVTFHPRMIYGYDNSAVWAKYVEPVLRNQSFGSCVFSSDTAWGREVIAALEHLAKLERIYYNIEESDLPVELAIQTELQSVWLRMITHFPEAVLDLGNETLVRNVERIRDVLDFMHTHYMEAITLEDAANVMNLCRSEACRFFKRYMHQPLFDYLLQYRLDRSVQLLAGTDKSITEVAGACGFASPAYYTKQFHKSRGMTPFQYRKEIQEKSTAQTAEAPVRA